MRLSPDERPVTSPRLNRRTNMSQAALRRPPEPRGPMTRNGATESGGRCWAKTIRVNTSRVTPLARAPIFGR